MAPLAGLLAVKRPNLVQNSRVARRDVAIAWVVNVPRVAAARPAALPIAVIYRLVTFSISEEH